MVVVHDVDLHDIIRCLEVIRVQLRSPHYDALVVVERGDHPEQP